MGVVKNSYRDLDRKFLGEGKVSHQICSAPVIGNGNAIPTDIERLVVQWLVDIADKMDDEAHRVQQLCGAGGRVLQLGGEVRNGTDDATALAAAVAGEVDAAARGRRVVGVDEVQWLGPGARAGVAVRVGPGGRVGHIIRRGVAKCGLHKGRRLGIGKVLRDIRDGFVAHGAPGVGNTDRERQRGGDEGDRHLHG